MSTASSGTLAAAAELPAAGPRTIVSEDVQRACGWVLIERQDADPVLIRYPDAAAALYAIDTGSDPVMEAFADAEDVVEARALEAGQTPSEAIGRPLTQDMVHENSLDTGDTGPRVEEDDHGDVTVFLSAEQASRGFRVEIIDEG